MSDPKVEREARKAARDAAAMTAKESAALEEMAKLVPPVPPPKSDFPK